MPRPQPVIIGNAALYVLRRLSVNLAPITLAKANDFVAEHHRHNGRTARNGGKFAIALMEDDLLLGVAIVGNPLSASFMDGYTAEVLRCCVLPEAKNGCSMLYSACWRAWRAMGGRRLITYTLTTESGASLRGSAGRTVAQCQPTKPGWYKNDHLWRNYQPVQGQQKLRWERA